MWVLFDIASRILAYLVSGAHGRELLQEASIEITAGAAIHIVGGHHLVSIHDKRRRLLLSLAVVFVCQIGKYYIARMLLT